jgi:hypothetical protein
MKKKIQWEKSRSRAQLTGEINYVWRMQELRHKDSLGHYGAELIIPRCVTIEIFDKINDVESQCQIHIFRITARFIYHNYLKYLPPPPRTLNHISLVKASFSYRAYSTLLHLHNSFHFNNYILHIVIIFCDTLFAHLISMLPSLISCRNFHERALTYTHAREREMREKLQTNGLCVND